VNLSDNAITVYRRRQPNFPIGEATAQKFVGLPHSQRVEQAFDPVFYQLPVLTDYFRDPGYQPARIAFAPVAAADSGRCDLRSLAGYLGKTGC
jgi:hypothetical protein